MLSVVSAIILLFSVAFTSLVSCLSVLSAHLALPAFNCLYILVWHLS